jgi:hypothetical protein
MDTNRALLPGFCGIDVSEKETNSLKGKIEISMHTDKHKMTFACSECMI